MFPFNPHNNCKVTRARVIILVFQMSQQRVRKLKSLIRRQTIECVVKLHGTYIFQFTIWFCEQKDKQNPHTPFGNSNIIPQNIQTTILVKSLLYVCVCEHVCVCVLYIACIYICMHM